MNAIDYIRSIWHAIIITQINRSCRFDFKNFLSFKNIKENDFPFVSKYCENITKLNYIINY